MNKLKIIGFVTMMVISAQEAFKEMGLTDEQSKRFFEIMTKKTEAKTKELGLEEDL